MQTQTHNTRFEWTPEQSAARERLRQFLAGPPGVFTLGGYAGTGKTTLVVDVLRDHIGKICFSAPTHKAVGVLAGRGLLPGAEYSTLHRLLGCRKQRSNGVTEFLPDFDRAGWRGYGVIVVDEVSMIGERMHGWIADAQSSWPRHVICMGDPAQLPPVNDGDGLSPMFDAIDSQLTEVKRSAGVVLEAAHTVRAHLDDVEPVVVRTGRDELGEVVTLDRDDFLDEAIATFRAGDDAKILAWTNDAVDWLNSTLRRALFGDAASETPQPGELLVVVSTWSDPDESAMLHAEREIVVEEATEVDWLGVPAWRIYAREVDVPLYMVRPEGRRAYRAALDDAKFAARAGRGTWKAFYELDDAFIRLRPGYATTVHKSQGSTYAHAFVVDRNLRACPDHAVRNMLRYVAFSRASRRLVLS